MEELGLEFQVTASLEIEGEVYGVKSVPVKMVIGKAQAMGLCTDEASNGTSNILCSLECK